MTRRAPSEAPELPGYAFERLLGSGGFSDVFLYEQKLPRRKVAVKVLLTDQLDQQSRTHFVSEANVMAQLSAHPYIVTIYHADVSADDRPYFVMEYCSGPSLSERYKRERFEVADALRIGVRVASAVATAHAAGILHRDIKPGNVLTNDFGWPALTDFGISSTLEDELPIHTTTTLSRLPSAGSADTTSKQSVGLSVPWSPPEMFEDDPKPDVRSDVFSLAATIYTLLAGHTPFEIPGRPNGTLDLIGRIERGAIAPLNRPDAPRTLVAVLAKGMASRREDRFDSAVDFARALQRVELELGYTPTGIEVPNLAIASSRQASAPGADSEDETRVRQVATIVAQPPDARPHAAPPSTGQQPAQAEAEAAAVNADATRLRDIPAVEAQRVAARDEVGEKHDDESASILGRDRTVIRRAPIRQAPAGPEDQTPESHAVADAERPEAQRAVRGHSGEVADDHERSSASRRRGVIAAGVAAACVLVLAGGITAAALLIPHGGASPSTTDAPGSDDGQIAVSSVPDPTEASAVRSTDGTTVTFTWKNPKPKTGDSYQWQQEGTTQGPTQSDQPKAVVAGLTPGSSVCIDVAIVRGGRTSPNPLKACSP
ncbi:protein kinase domain-containing protein [Rathayibacter sp. KR2-224]|uniref:serine/threonine protein kinase n=1 Tax=Rathayibacter sp. KR2-224 TaxID=3400913 RepID=UPI003C0E9A3E